MHVRITIVTGATNFDAGLDFLKTDAIPTLRQQKGYRGMSASGDRASGTLNILTQWDTEADMDASESGIEKVRRDAVDKTGGTMTVERYEQLASEIKTPPTPGAKLHIREIKMDPSKIDENLQFFKQVIVPEFMNSAGFLSMRNLMNRSTGEGRVGTIWADDASLQAQLAQTEQRRARAQERGVTFGQDHIAELIFAAFE